MVPLLCIALAMAAACKRHEAQGEPNDDECGRKLDCLLCTADVACGWCGGTHCGPTGSGCYNRTLHDSGNVCRHEVTCMLRFGSLFF